MKYADYVYYPPKSISKFVLFIILTSWYINTSALPEDASSPIDITADAVELDEAAHVSTYSGKVEAQQGSMHLWADQVKVYHLPSRQPKRIVATGQPVRYQQQERNGNQISHIEAQAKRIEYDLVTDEILLTDDARFTRDQDLFTSDRIFYNRVKGIIRGGRSAKGHQRVHIRIFPRTEPKKHTKRKRVHTRMRPPYQNR